LSGGGVEVMDGTQVVASKNFSGAGKSFVVKGTDPYSLSIIEPSSQNSGNYWYNWNNTLLVQNLLIRHTWNVSFAGDVSTASALIYAYGDASLVIERVTFNTVYSTLLTQCVVVYAYNSGNNITIVNSVFQNIGLSQVSLLYDYWDCMYTVTNTTFKDILSMNVFFLQV
jgi:hypothetical protein